jgi:hypothetical protein
MSKTLKLTFNELNKIINGEVDKRFEEVFDDMPLYHPEHVFEKGETHRNYQEDDNREYRWFIFNDTKTNIEYCLNYTYHPEFSNDLMDFPDSIEIVANIENSDIYIKPEVEVKSKKKTTPEQEADKHLLHSYKAIQHECKFVEKKEKLKIPKAEIDSIILFIKNEKFNIYQLRAVIIPLCIKYNLEEKSFWQWIQAKIRHYKD